MASANTHTFTEANFEAEVLKSDVPVLVDFWATWCGPCRALAPAIDEIASEMAGKIKVGKVDVDQNNSIAANYGIQSIPTLKIFKNGKVVDSMVGAQPKSDIIARINSHITGG